MIDSQLGNAELGSTQLGDVGSSGGGGTIVFVNVSNTLTATQTISFVINQSYLVSVSNTLTSTQNIFVNSPRVVSVSNYGTVRQTYTSLNATYYVTVNNSFVASQIYAARNGVVTVSVTNTFAVSQSAISRDQIVIVSMSHAMTVKQRINSEYKLILVSTASVTQEYVTQRITTASLVDSQTLTDDFESQKTRILYLSDIQTLEESYTRAGQYERTFADYQVLTDTFRQAILVTGSGYSYDYYPVGSGQPPIVISPHPVVSGTPVIYNNQTVIESVTGAIILPAPEYGDTFGAKIQSTIKKTMTGKIYTYVKTNVNDKFTLTWILGVAKAYELANFINDYIENKISTKLTLYLWNGEIWSANVITTDIPVTYEGRWQNSDNNNGEIEKVNVVIGFEGLRIL